MSYKIILFITVLFVAIMVANPLSAKPLVGDISSHEITLHTAFKGTELMLFGARNDPGDIIVVVRGPNRKATVRRKEKAYGIWINRTQQTFEDVPGFYALASSQPYDLVEKSLYFDALGIGYDAALAPFVGVKNKEKDKQKIREKAIFQKSLIRHLRDEGLYEKSSASIKFIGTTLFKIVIPFPDNMPRGTYTAEIYLFSDGELVGSHVTPINVHKIGFDSFIYQMAQSSSVAYGILAVLLAVFGGVSASFIFRRV